MRETYVIIFLCVSAVLLIYTTEWINNYIIQMEQFQTEQLSNLRYIQKCKDRSNTFENITTPYNGQKLVLQPAYPSDIYTT